MGFRAPGNGVKTNRAGLDLTRKPRLFHLQSPLAMFLTSRSAQPRIALVAPLGLSRHGPHAAMPASSATAIKSVCSLALVMRLR